MVETLDNQSVRFYYPEKHKLKKMAAELGSTEPLHSLFPWSKLNLSRCAQGALAARHADTELTKAKRQRLMRGKQTMSPPA